MEGAFPLITTKYIYTLVAARKGSSSPDRCGTGQKIIVRLRGQLPHASDRGGPVVMLRLFIKLIIRSARSESETAAVSRLSCYCQVLIRDYSSKYECLRLEPRGRLICHANAAATNTREWLCERS